MRVAFILYGFFRTFDYVRDTLRANVIEPLDCDVFINTPDIINFKPEPFDENSVREFFGSSLKALDVRHYDDRVFKRFAQSYQMPETNVHRQPYWAVSSFFYSVASSVKTFQRYVRRTGTQYDVVILARPDLRYYQPLDPSVIQLDRINCPSSFLIFPDEPELLGLEPHLRTGVDVRRRFGGAGVWWPESPNEQRWLNDQIIAGSQESMLRYASLFESAPDYLREGICYNQETYIGVHAVKTGMGFTHSPFVSYELWRLERPDWLPTGDAE